MEIWPGEPYPLGGSFDGTGTNFSLFSDVAELVELCLFDEEGTETRVDLPERTALCCNPAKLLLDPYAKAIEGNVRWNRAIFPYALGEADLDLAVDHTDSGTFMPKSIVIDPWFLWKNDRRLRIPWHETVIYELHVKGFTCDNSDVPPELR